MKHVTRRQFVSASAAVAATGLVGKSAWGAAKVSGMSYGVQLYMLREQAKTDLPGAFKAVKDAGFDQVELFPTAYAQPAETLRKMISDAGLGTVSGHFDYATLESKLDYAKAIGMKYMICAAIPKEQWTSLAGFRQAAEVFNRVGKGAKERGMQFAFHNHCYEFKPLEGSSGFAELMKASDPSLVKLEPDCYWLTQGGQDPVNFIKQHSDRVVLLHLKDRLPNAPVSYDMSAPQHFTELGAGTIDWPGILNEGRRLGVKYAFLDQDGTSIPIPDSMRKSRTYLRSISA